MRKVLSIKIEFEYEDSKDNEEIVQRMYNRIFEQAKQIVIARRKIKREEEKSEKVFSIRPIGYERAEELSKTY